MKRSILFLALFSVSVLTTAQTVRIVDNNANAPTGPEIYSTIQEAVDASYAANPAGGDIIYVQPSPTAYAGVTIQHPVTLLGIGFDLTKDLPHVSTIGGDILLRNNQDNTVNSSGTVLKGLNINGGIYFGSTQANSYTLSDVIIENNQIDFFRQGSSNYSHVDNLLFVDNDIVGSTSSYFYYNVTNSVFRNNVFRASSLYFYTASRKHSVIFANNIAYCSIGKESFGDNFVIDHNIFVGATGSHFAFNNKLLDAIISNNIFYGRTPSIAAGGSTSTNFQRNIFNNNLTSGTGDNTLPPTGGGVGNTGDSNIAAQSPSFTDVPLLNTWSTAYDYTLQVGSPAIDASSETPQENLGISGGAYAWDGNFKLDTSPLPTVEIFNTNTIINPGDPLPVRVKAKGN